MNKEILLNGKIVGKKYGVVKSLDKNGYRSDGYFTDSPFVIYDGSTYKMWYTGYDGSHYGIHYAISEDGKDWTKHGVVKDLDTDGETNDTYNHSPSVIFDGIKYNMWYTVYNGNKHKIHYAISEDGINWKKQGEVVNLGDYFSRHPILSPYSKHHNILSPFVIYDGKMYKMWYNIYDGNHYRIHYATSTDGIFWDEHKIVTLLDPTIYSDDVYPCKPSIIFDGNKYTMFYSASNCGYYRIHYATSEDGISWIKHGVVIPLGDEGDSDNEDTDAPFILLDGDIYKVWYRGFDGSVNRLHYAELTELNLK